MKGAVLPKPHIEIIDFNVFIWFHLKVEIC